MALHFCDGEGCTEFGIDRTHAWRRTRCLCDACAWKKGYTQGSPGFSDSPPKPLIDPDWVAPTAKKPPEPPAPVEIKTIQEPVMEDVPKKTGRVARNVIVTFPDGTEKQYASVVHAAEAIGGSKGGMGAALAPTGSGKIKGHKVRWSDSNSPRIEKPTPLAKARASVATQTDRQQLIAIIAGIKSPDRASITTVLDWADAILGGYQLLQRCVAGEVQLAIEGGKVVEA